MNKENTVFTEKYRPKKLDDVVGQENITRLLKGFVANKKIPHMLFTGPAGSGKTTSAKALARDLYGKEWQNYFLEMNASDDNSIAVVREKVKGYAQVKVIGQDFKIIFLDEADAITGPAQSALRRIIEMYSETCRFILSCNYPNKIIDPIKDRCTLFRFKMISKEQMMVFLKKVVEEESIDITEPALELLCDLAKGSMRKSLGTLEKLKNGNISYVNEEVIRDSFCYIDDNDIKALLTEVSKGNIDSMYDYIEELLFIKTYSTDEIVIALDRLIRQSKKLSSVDKANALLKLGELDYRISVGASAEIQLKCFVVYLYQLYKV